MASELCGQAAFTERVRYRHWGQSQSEDRREWHDVLTTDMIRQLPTGHALVVRANLSPVIARLGVAWKDRAYKAARRAGTAVAALDPAPEPAALDEPPPASPAWPGHPTLPGYDQAPGTTGPGDDDDYGDYPWD